MSDITGYFSIESTFCFLFIFTCHLFIEFSWFYIGVVSSELMYHFS